MTHTYPQVEVKSLIWLHMVSPHSWATLSYDPLVGHDNWVYCTDPGMDYEEQCCIWNEDMIGQEPEIVATYKEDWPRF